MSNFALRMFDSLREAYGKPMVVTSGCRCKEYNEKIGGAKSSAHLPDKSGLCYALDIACTSNEDRFKMISKAISIGCVRIGIAKNFLHLDFSPELKQNIIWIY